MAKAPMNPLAGPAGPGKYSTRPDQLSMGSIAYGEGKDTKDILRGAALAKAGPVPSATGSQVREAAARAVTPLYADTQRPDEPITYGVDTGDGEGSDALIMNQMQQASDRDKDFLAKYMPMLQTMAASPDSSESFRIFARSVQSLL